MGWQVGPSDKTARRRFGQTVNGNYGFADVEAQPVRARRPEATRRRPRPAALRPPGRRRLRRAGPAAPSDYIVSVDIPNDPVGRQADVQGHQRGGRQRLRRRQLPAAGELPAGHARRSPTTRPAADADADAAVAAAVAAGRHHLAPAPARCTRSTSPTRPSSPAAAAPSRARTARSCDDKLVTVARRPGRPRRTSTSSPTCRSPRTSGA